MSSVPIENEIKNSRRRRCGPNKKWSLWEEERILNYLKDTIQRNHEIEKPTATDYYQTFINQNPDIENVTPQTLKNKSKNLKSSYIAAINWKNNTGQGVNNEETIQHQLLRMCPHFDILSEIYSERPNVHVPYVVDTDPPNEDWQLEYLDSEHTLEHTESFQEPTVSQQVLSASGNDNLKKDSSKKRKYTSNSLSLLADIQSERTEMQKQKIEIEKEKMMMEYDIQKRKIELEERRFEEETANARRKQELEHELNLRRIEMEEKVKLAKIDKLQQWEDDN